MGRALITLSPPGHAHSPLQDLDQTVFSLFNSSTKRRDKQLQELEDAAAQRQVAAHLSPLACVEWGFCSGHVSNSAGHCN